MSVRRSSAARRAVLGFAVLLPCVGTLAQDPPKQKSDPGLATFARGIQTIADRIDAETPAKTRAIVVLVVEGGLVDDACRGVNTAVVGADRKSVV